MFEDFFIKIKADISDFKEGMSEASEQIGDFSQGVGGDLESKLDQSGKNISGFGKGMSKWVTGPIVGSLGAVAGLGKKTADTASEIKDSADVAGISTGAFQEWEYALGEAGLEGRQVGKLLERNTQRMGRAADGNEKYSDAYKDLGVDIRDSNGELRDSEDVFDDVVEGIAKIEDPAERASKAGELLGTRAGRQLAGALNEGSASVDEAKEKFHELGLEMDEGQIEQAEEFGIAMEDLKLQFGAVFRELGSKLIPVLQDDLLPVVENSVIPMVEKFGEFISDLVQWFGELSPWVQDVVLALAGFFAIAGPALVIIGQVVSAIGGIVGVFKALWPIIGGIGKLFTLFTNPIGIVILIIGALVFFVVKYWDEIKEVTKKVFGWIKDFLVGLWEGIKEIWDKAVTFLKDLVVGIWQKIKEKTAEIWNKLKEFFVEFFEKLKDVFFKFHPVGIIVENWSEIKEKTVEIWNAIKDFFTDFIENWISQTKENFNSFKNVITTPIGKVKDFFVNAWEYIKDFFDGFLTTFVEQTKENFNGVKDAVVLPLKYVKDFFVDIWNSVKEFFSEWISNYVEDVKENFNKVKSVITNVFTTVRDKMKEIWNSVKEFFADAFQNFKDQTKENFNQVKDTITSIFTKSIDIIKDITSKVLDIGVNIVKGIWQGIKDTSSWLWEKLTGFVSKIVETFKNVLGIKSPSTEMAGQSEHIVTGIWDGIKNMGGFIKEKVGDFTSNIIGNFKTGLSKVKDIGDNIVKGIGKGMSDAGGWLKEKVGGLSDMIKKKFEKDNDIKSPSRVFASLGEFISEGIGKGIEDGEDEALTPLEKLSRMLKEGFDGDLGSIGFEGLDTSNLDVDSSLKQLKGQQSQMLTDSKTDNTVSIELEGDLSKLVDTVKTNVGKDVQVKSSGKLI